MSRLLGSVRARVTVGAVLIVSLALLLVGVATLRITGSGMIREAQHAAEAQARSLAVVAQAGRLDPILAADTSGNIVMQVVSASGDIIAASAALAGMPPLVQVVPEAGYGRASTIRIQGNTIPGESADYRIVTLGANSPSGPIAVSVGVSLMESQQTLNVLGTALLGGSVVVMVVVAGATWWVTSRALRPVEAIRVEVDGLNDTQLDRRVPVPPSQDEVQRLAITMNRMLARLESSHQRQQAFVADAAHELRSPLASLRTQLEVAAAHPEGITTKGLAEEALEDTQRLEALAIDLLRLARLDAGQAVRVEVVDVGSEVADVLSQRRGYRVPVRFAAASRETFALSSSQVVTQVVTNLVDNAVRHAESAVEVAISGEGDESVAVVVSDDGPGIKAADRERVFERFVRLDDTRSREQGGTGLGLAIVRELARASGGDVTVVAPQSPTSSGATFRFSMRAPTM